MKTGLTVAIVGATGLVGKEMLSTLQRRQFDIKKMIPLASVRSAGEAIMFDGRSHLVKPATTKSFDGVDLVLMSAGAEASRTLAPAAVASGATVIDNSSAWRMDSDVALVVPEVNGHVLAERSGPRIIANPNCSTIQMVMVLAPLHDHATLSRVVVSTYQAVSGAGQAGLTELGDQVTALLSQQDVVTETFARRIAFNCLPQIDAFLPNGQTKEEQKMVDETRKILGTPKLGICATCVRVPVFNGHSLSVTAEFAKPLALAKAHALIASAPGIQLLDADQPAAYPTILEAEGQDTVFVGRLRKDDSVAHGLSLWCVADNLRKGAATNAVQIAEAWAKL